MKRRTQAAFAVAAAVALVGAVFVGVFASGGSSPSAEVLLERSAEVMARETFSLTASCEHCEEPTRIEYAPPDRIRLTSGSPRGDNWPHYLYLDGRAYFSESGVRWQFDSEDGNGWLAFYQRMLDPRVLLTTVSDAQTGEPEGIAGHKTRSVTARLNFDAMLEAIPPEERDIGQGEVRQLLESAEATFWIDTDDYRLRRMRLVAEGEDGDEGRFDFDFETPVDIRDSVESMEAEEANRLGFEAEKAYERLLAAIGDYHRSNGEYPPEVTPESLGEFLPPDGWPTNPFTGEPVRYEPGTPGNFDYRLIANGEHTIFQIDGWDGSRAYYDSERFGPIQARAR